MKKFVAVLGVIIAMIIGAPASSNAGGWVVVSLDAVPSFREGDSVEVGFTVLRHGVTPENGEDLAVVLTDQRGRAHRFDVVQQGAVGHHVAAIEVPSAGDYTWRVTGSFVDFDLGRIDVTGAGGGETTWTWNALQWGSAALAVAMGCLAGRDVLRARRSRASVTATA